MLYKNDEMYKLIAADHKFINNRFHKFPITLTYPEKRVRPSRLSHNRLPDKPNSISFPLHATVKTETGTQSWRYCENRMIGTDGKIIWQPHNLILRDSIVLQKTDIELIYWLVKFCPFLEGGENFNGKVPKCAIEDLAGKASKRALHEEQKADVKALIYSQKVGLGESRLREIAKAYFIPEVNELTYDQVKLAVESMISRNKRTGYQEFLDMVDSEQTLLVRGRLQQAIDDKIIIYMAPKNTWAWVTDTGKKNVPICTVSGASEPNSAIYDFYMGNRSFAQSLDAALVGEKVVAAEGAELAGPEE